LDIKLKEMTTKYGAGLPEERFNMCVEYDATIRFKAGDPPPDRKLLKMLIIECNLSSILAHVRTLKPLCFKKTTEVSMQRKSTKKEEDPSPEDAIFEAVIDSPTPSNDPPLKKELKKETPEISKPPKKWFPQKVEPKKVEPKKHAPKKVEPQKHAPKKVEPQKHAPKKVEPKKVEPKKHAPKKVEPKDVEPKKVEPKRPSTKKVEPKLVEPKKAEPKKVEPKKIEPKKPAPKKQEPKKLKPIEAPRKKKKEMPAQKDTNAPSAPIVTDKLPAPSNEEHTIVNASDIYVALQLDGIDSEPTPEEYEKLRQQTQEFFVMRVRKRFPKQFVSMDLQIGLHEFGADKPNPKYNVYLEWDINASFTSSSPSSSPSPVKPKSVMGTKRTSVTNDGSDGPGPAELTSAIVQGADIMNYLLKHVRTIEDSGFANTTAGYFQQRSSMHST
jgi:hypothetical protein